MKYYFAYGSNLDLDHMKSICPNSKFLGITKLVGYKLAFRGEIGRSYLTVIENTTSAIFGGIFQILNDDESSLDHYEDYPNLYDKKEVIIKLNNIDIVGFMYTMNPKYPFNLPKEDYINLVVDSYKFHNIEYKPIYDALKND